MSYEGKERRKEQLRCALHEKLLNDIRVDVAVTAQKVEHLDKRINGSMDAIQQHIRQGDGWRKAIVANAIGLLVILCSLAVGWGAIQTTVDHNEKELEKLSAYHDSQN